MTIEHSIVTDPNIHEPKDISSAASGTVYIADGVGSGSWSQLNPGVTLTNVLTAAELVDQGPSVVDTAHQITFGAAQFTISDPVMLSAAGAITFNQAGNYEVSIVTYQGRTGGAGTAELFGRALVNSTQIGSTTQARLDDADVIDGVTVTFLRAFSQNDVLTFEFIRDSSGNNSGTLIAGTPTAAGWVVSPSAAITIDRIS